jgi:hypothetical protein
MEPDITYGFEIEGVFNLDDDVEIGDYHDGIEVNGWWKAESDSSIYRDALFTMEKEVEFVSRKVHSERFLTALKSFRSIFGDGELSEHMYFNKTCGCHIHFSIPKTKFLRVTPFENYAKMRTNFLKKLKNSNLHNELKESVTKQYFRTYATKLEKYEWGRFSNGYPPRRQSEFNFCSESGGYGLEWRSFNLMGVKTWKEFFALFEIAKDVIEDFVKESINYKKVNRFKLNNKVKGIEVVKLEVRPQNQLVVERLRPNEIVVPVFR